MNEETPRNENGIAGKPLYPTVNANGNVFDSLQASNTQAPPLPKPDPQESIDRLHKESPIPHIRTYESDVAEALKKNQTSVVHIAVTENKKKEEIKKKVWSSSTPLTSSTPTQPPQKSQASIYSQSASHSKSSFLITLIVIIIVGAGGTGTWYLLNRNPTSPLPVTVSPSQVISTDSTQAITLAPEAMPRISREDVTGQVADNSLVQFTFTQAPDTQTFFNVLKTQAPDYFLRTLKPTYSVGLHTQGNGNPYLIIKTSSYDTAYAGMITWEKTLLKDFKDVFVISAEPVSQIFKDKRIDTSDVRYITDTGGNTILLYSFIDKETIIITTREETLQKLIGLL